MGLITAVLDSQQVATHIYELDIAGANHWFEARIAPAGGADWVIWLSWEVTERLRIEQRERALNRLYGFSARWTRRSYGRASRTCSCSACAPRRCATVAGTWPGWAGWRMRGDLCVPMSAPGPKASIPRCCTARSTRPARRSRGLAWRCALPVRCGSRTFAARRAPPWGEAAIAAGWSISPLFRCAGMGRGRRAVSAVRGHAGPRGGGGGRLLDEVGADLSFALTQFQRLGTLAK